MEGQLEAVRAGVGVIVTLEPVVRALGPQAGLAFPVAGLEPVEFAVAWRAADERREVAGFVRAATGAYAGTAR